MSSVVSGLADIFQSISSIPSTIINGIGDFFTELFSYFNPLSDNFILKPIINFFTELLSYLNPFSENFILKIFFDWISDLLKEIFVPDTDVINEQFTTTMENLKNRLGITMFDLNNLFNKSATFSDVSGDYNIYGVGTLNLSFVNYDYLIAGVNYFRPFIRGFIVLMLFIFNIRQLLSMFGISSGEIAAAHDAKERESDRK